MPTPREPLFDPSFEPCVLSASDPGPKSPSGSNSPYNQLKQHEDVTPRTLFHRRRRHDRCRCTVCLLCPMSIALLVIAVVGLQKFHFASVDRRPDAGRYVNAAAALRKVTQLVGAHMRDGGASAGEIEAGSNIHTGNISGQTLSGISTVLNNANLQDAMKTGSVITIDDMNRLAECKFGEALGEVHLEEQSTTSAGVLLLQGDMAVPIHNESNATWRAHARKLSAGQHWMGRTWKNGDVRYCFSPNATPEAREAWALAVGSLKEQVPCLHLEEVTAVDSSDCSVLPSIMVMSVPRDGCWSHIGQVSGDLNFLVGSQPLNLGRGCESSGLAAHQLGHALGLPHEQSRPERSGHLAVNPSAVRDGMVEQLAVKSWVVETTGSAQVPQEYDLLSVMHFPATAFGKRGLITLVPHDTRATALMGQRMGFSAGDVQKLGSLYGCRPDVSPMASTELLDALKRRVDDLVAPVTKDQCLCKEHWAVEGMIRCASAENGWCCDPDEDPGGSWCVTEGSCLGRVWDYCKPRSPTEERTAPVTVRGCRCRSMPTPQCATEETGFCCNSDGDPNGNWCRTEEPCGGADYDYCMPPRKSNTTSGQQV
uniref:Metalloendopeptidase n=1 Tax=Pyrodinium bahamense TaxID=73915 RepID=A0A7S0FAS4_9DINO